MTTELRVRNQSQQLYVRALSQAWRNSVQLHDPSLWLLREPEIEEKMLRDADIRQAIDYRKHLVAGRDWTLTPLIDTSEHAEMAVFIGTELLKRLKHFTQGRENLARAFFSGSRFARIHGKPKTLTLGDGKPRTWWVPTRLEDLDKRMFRIVPQHDGEKITAHWERWNLAAQAWEPEMALDAIQTIRHVYEDDQAQLGHGAALREAIGWWWYAKEHVFMESLQAVERFAQGILHAKVDGTRNADSGLPNAELIAEWVSTLEDQRAKHVLVSDKNDEIEVITGNAEGYQLLADIRGELKTTLTTLILGANLPTTATEGGSYALGGIQENTTEALVQFDREILQETLTDDLLGCLWFKNHANLIELGVADEKPLFTITQEKRQEPSERANVAEVLSRMGVDLAADDIYEQTGFRKPEEGEDIIPGGSAAPAVPPGFGFAK
jgi:hypothetical protein